MSRQPKTVLPKKSSRPFDAVPDPSQTPLPSELIEQLIALMKNGTRDDRRTLAEFITRHLR